MQIEVGAKLKQCNDVDLMQINLRLLCGRIIVEPTETFKILVYFT